MLTLMQLHTPADLEECARTELAATGGTWWGEGAADLGLAPGSRVDVDTFVDLYTGFLDPRGRGQQAPSGQRPTLGTRPGRYMSTAQHMERLRKEQPDLEEAEVRALARRRTRNPMLCEDATYGAVKSLGVLHAACQAQAQRADARGDLEEAFAWHQRAAQVRAAVMEGNAAMLQTLQDHAGTARAGRGGTSTVEAKGWVVAVFPRSWNRGCDPFLYVRNLVLNRVERADGKWRTLDSRKIAKARSLGAAVAERVTMERLTQTLGVEFTARPDRNGFELVGIAEKVLEEFSTRSRQIRESIGRGGASSLRGPTYRLTHYPALNTRLLAEAQHGHRIPGELVDWWESRMEQAGLPPLEAIAGDCLGRRSGEAETPARGVLRAAQAAVAAEGRSGARSLRDRGWLALRINNHLPGYLGGLDAEGVRALLAEGVASYCPTASTQRAKAASD